jgi:hypothetical protein
MSSHEFQSGLTQRFVERDGMVFLPDQVAEYDKKRLQVAVAPQMEMFVSDERSAIDWLSPKFRTKIGGLTIKKQRAHRPNFVRKRDG